MARKQWTPEERKAFGDKMRALRAARESKTTQTPHPLKEEATPAPSPTDYPTEAEKVAAAVPSTPQGGNVTLSAEQFQALIDALSKGNTSAPAQFSGQQTNAMGQVVGSITKYEPDPNYYPNPIEDLISFFETNPKTKRLAFRDNYFLKWEISSKPYDTKYGTSIIEPTFHLSIYTPLFDEQGNETGGYRALKSFDLNEDESTALLIAHDLGITATHENMREVMNTARFERIKRLILADFFPENSFAASSAFDEQAIGGTVVKVVTKSSVVGFDKAPRISVEELQ